MISARLSFEIINEYQIEILNSQRGMASGM